MEGQTPAPAAPTPTPQSSGSSVQSNHILMVVLGGIVLGFAFGIGTIFANKVMKKTVAIVPSDSASGINGVNSSMYPPRQQMQRQQPVYPMQGHGYPNRGYMQANGAVNDKFSVDSWLGNNGKPMSEADFLAQLND